MAAATAQSGLPTPPLLSTGFPEDDPSNPFSDAHKADGDATAAQASSFFRYERKMGETELSYFLPSRQSGVNDMYLHLGFRAPKRIAQRERVCTVWAILRLRHPLLCAQAQMRDYDDVRFVYDAPASAQVAYADAEANIEFSTQSKDALIHAYLNGPRTLSNTRLSYLILSHPPVQHHELLTPPPTPDPTNAGVQLPQDPHEDTPHQYDLLICAMHFLGDGMALHQFANHFFGLLGGDKTDAELSAILQDEWRSRWGAAPQVVTVLPAALEDNMPIASRGFRRAAAKVDFDLSQQKLIGGHVFPRQKHPDRETIVPTVAFPEERTKAMLKKCKAHGVSISAAIFAICNVAWARTGGGDRKLPIMMYSALNLRPYFSVRPAPPWDSYWYLAIGFFNVILPNFVPTDAGKLEVTFWHRAREAKDQSTRAAKHPLLVSRTHEMARERGERARTWGKEDDERENGTWKAPAPKPAEAPKESVLPARAKPPNAALIGLSLLGNLDGVYKHAEFPHAELHTLTTGSRQRHGAMLLFGYTFKGKLWLSLGYDRNGFAGNSVERFWKDALDCVDQFLGN